MQRQTWMSRRFSFQLLGTLSKGLQTLIRRQRYVLCFQSWIALNFLKDCMKKLLSPSKTLMWMISVCNPASNNQNKQARRSRRGWSSGPKVILLRHVKWYKKIKSIERAKKNALLGRSGVPSGNEIKAWWDCGGLVPLSWSCFCESSSVCVECFCFVPLFWQKTVWFSLFFFLLYIWGWDLGLFNYSLTCVDVDRLSGLLKHVLPWGARKNGLWLSASVAL